MEESIAKELAKIQKAIETLTNADAQNLKLAKFPLTLREKLIRVWINQTNQHIDSDKGVVGYYWSTSGTLYEHTIKDGHRVLLLGRTRTRQIEQFVPLPSKTRSRIQL